MQQKYMYLIVGIALGLVFSPQLRRLPLVSKLPSA